VGRREGPGAWRDFFGALASAGCTDFTEVQLVTVRCVVTAGADRFSVQLVNFVNILSWADGGAVYVWYDAVVQVREDSFMHCAAQTTTADPVWTHRFGGGVYLGLVRSGTSVADCCARQCSATYGGFAYLTTSNIDVEYKGLSAFECFSQTGALNHDYARMIASETNLTGLKGVLWDVATTAVIPAICQDRVGASTTGSFLLFANCSGGQGCFMRRRGNATTLRQCLFIRDGVPAIAHYTSDAKGQDVLTSCYFDGTGLRGSVFDAGSVLLENCLFESRMHWALWHDGHSQSGIRAISSASLIFALCLMCGLRILSHGTVLWTYL
jgi:hypothetical protein